MMYNIGNLIKERREELNISQSSLCRGICNPATLSRIENGSCISNKQVIYHLLERLGFYQMTIEDICSESDYKIAQMIIKARRLYVLEKFDEAADLVDKLSEDYENLSPTNRRFCDTMNTLMLRKKKIIDPAQALVNYEKILRETCPRYSINNLPQIMDHDEITLLNCISNCYYNMGRSDISIKILYHIKDFHERGIIDDVESIRSLPMILYNLSKFLGLAGKYDECIEICEHSINKQILSGRNRCLPKTMYNLAWSLVRRRGEGDLEYARETILNAYYTSKALKNDELAKNIEKFIKENFEDLYLYIGAKAV